ncbi:MAG TPA: HlyD family efflux transporter periplasmic adaptor subunit [Phycisphaerales bacterium]|nr:HlyD family efflux transporter periplasmic adaptor subunit [Phycisphaerales bacterium]
MSINRPSFHESWHRVEGLRPSLRPGVRVTRQLFRGEVWHVAEDPATGQFFRMSGAAWAFVGLLDGSRNVAEAWRGAGESIGDDAPTQPEAIQVLSQLFAANLLLVDAPPDAVAILRRRTERRTRQAASLLASHIFFRVPILDPDRFLTALAPAVSWLFSPLGFVLWVFAVGFGAYHLVGRERELLSNVGHALDAENLVPLGVTFALVKLCHEFGHAFACKVFGKREATSATDAPGAVHSMGLMFLMLLPAPYVDATSAWAFRNKLSRIIVGAAGMMVELVIASVAAVVWSRSAEGTAVHTIAWNVIFLAGVTTLLFNLNPLLRFDGYFILCDILETPNLSQRAFRYVGYLVKKHAWGLRRAVDPSHTPGERPWLLAYAVGSGVYRVLLCAGILLFIADQHVLIGAIMIVFTLILWVAAPLYFGLRSLLFGRELASVRRRAVWTTVGAVAAVVLVVGFVPFPRSVRLRGVVEPIVDAEVFAETDGFVDRVLAPGAAVDPAGESLLVATNDEWITRRREIEAEIDSETIARRAAVGTDPAKAEAHGLRVATLREQFEWTSRNIDNLTVRAPVQGVWMPSASRESLGGSVRRGERIGRVFDPAHLRVRAAAGQHEAGLIVNEANPEVEFRAVSDPAHARAGSIERVDPSAHRVEASEEASRRSRGKPNSNGRADSAAASLFDVLIASGDTADLRPGQSVVVRVRLADAPLLTRWWQDLSRVLQQRLRVGPMALDHSAGGLVVPSAVASVVLSCTPSGVPVREIADRGSSSRFHRDFDPRLQPSGPSGRKADFDPRLQLSGPSGRKADCEPRVQPAVPLGRKLDRDARLQAAGSLGRGPRTPVPGEDVGRHALESDHVVGVAERVAGDGERSSG